MSQKSTDKIAEPVQVSSDSSYTLSPIYLNEAQPRNLPETFRIAGITWEIEVVPVSTTLPPANKGYADWELSKVVLADTSDDPVQKRTLLHELVHVADVQGNLEMSEVQVTVLANNLWAVLADNPDLVRYLFQGE